MHFTARSMQNKMLFRRCLKILEVSKAIKEEFAEEERLDAYIWMAVNASLDDVHFLEAFEGIENLYTKGSLENNLSTALL